MSGKLIVLEGVDHVGKSTQVDLLWRRLASEVGWGRVTVVKFPRYDTFLGRCIAEMLSDGSARTWRNLFQVVQWLDKFVFQAFTLKHLLRKHDYVIFDRWRASMWAYGLADGAGIRLTNALVDSLVEADLTVVLSGPSRRRSEPEDCYERSSSFQRDVERRYQLWSCMEENVCTVDAGGTPEEVHARVSSLLPRI